jgi:hypothetical protein
MIALADHGQETTVAKQPQGQRTIAELTKTISASRLSTWQSCRLQFYFRYVAGPEIANSCTPHRKHGSHCLTAVESDPMARAPVGRSGIERNILQGLDGLAGRRTN